MKKKLRQECAVFVLVSIFITMLSIIKQNHDWGTVHNANCWQLEFECDTTSVIDVTPIVTLFGINLKLPDLPPFD